MAAQLFSFTQTITPQQIETAMTAVAYRVAAESGMPDDGRVTVESAMRMPVSLAAAYADLCMMLGIIPPASVDRALHD